MTDNQKADEDLWIKRVFAEHDEIVKQAQIMGEQAQ